MAKYFHSPCKSMRSMYSEEQIYHLLGENTSMRRLLTEKNAVIESLQEQVTNAKEKLVELLKAECNMGITQVSAVSNSTLTFHQHKAANDQATNSESQGPPNSDPEVVQNHSMATQAAESNKREDTKLGAEERGDSQEVVLSSQEPTPDNDLAVISRNVSFADNLVNAHKEQTEKLADGTSEAWEQLSRKVNYVSCEKLQEILKELSVETLSGCSQTSPRRLRRGSHSVHRETIAQPPESFRNVCISLSPYITRRRRGHRYGRRSVLPSSQYSRAVFGPPRCPTGSRDPYNGANALRDDAGDMRLDEGDLGHYRHSSVPVLKMESNGQENGGHRVTILSEPLESGLVQPNHWNGPAAYGSLTIRPQTLCSESDSSSSEETLCFCGRPYCDICSPATCDSSDSCTTDMDTLEGWPAHHRHLRPIINFKEDLTPTFV